MGNATYIGRVATLAAVVLGIRNVRHSAMRTVVSTGVAVLVVMAAAVPMPASTLSPAVRLSSSSEPCKRTDVTCALIMGFTSLPTPDDFYVESVKNQFIAPTHPDQNIESVAVTTPEQGWPLTGVLRVSCLAVGPPSLCGPGGPVWPDEPWWKLSGLFDLTYDQSIQAGLADLEDAIAEHPNDHLVIYGYSQGAIIANLEKQRLAEQYPGTEAPDIDFVVGGDGNLPNGGIHSRFSGLYIPIVDFSFNGPAPTDTQFDTVEINREYDLYADFPLYPLNVISLFNAFLGFFYVHLHAFDVSLPAEPTKSPAYQGKYGDTSYYFFKTEDLPLFGPLRTLGVPESVIDVVEPVFKVIVDLGYDRSIRPWEPTPARLIPPLDPAKVAADLVDAVGEGINNAAALFGNPASTAHGAAVDQVVSASEATVKRAGSQVLTAVGSPLPQPPAVTDGNRQASQDEVEHKLPSIVHRLKESIGAVESVIGNGRTTVRSGATETGSPASTAGSARRTPVRDAIREARSGVKKVVAKVSDGINDALGGGKHGDITAGDEDAER